MPAILKKQPHIILLALVLFVVLGTLRLKFNPTQKTSNNPPPAQDEVFAPQLTEVGAVQIVESFPEVADYLQRVPNGQVRFSRETDDGKLVVQVFEVNESRMTATFNWYEVDKNTEEITKVFDFETAPTKTKETCIISGCNNEICADEEMSSACVYRNEFACYKNATCEMQDSGECGWTLSSKLQQCLESFMEEPSL